MKKKARPRFSI